jgi:Putative auto-transporter adhesin, head GIN domain
MIRTLILVAIVGFFLSIGAMVTAIGFAGGLSGIESMLQTLSQNKNLHWSVTSNDHDHSIYAKGPVITRDFTWAPSDRLEVNDVAEITYIQGPTARLTIEAPKAVLDDIEIEDGTISRRNDNDWGGKLKVTLTAPNVHSFELGGVQSLTLRQYDQQDLKINLSGTGHVSGTGRVKVLSLDISGAGSADLSAMQMDDAEVSLSGAGSAKIGPKSNASVSISGIGGVELTRTPAHLSSSISGLGQIKQPGPAI